MSLHRKILTQGDLRAFAHSPAFSSLEAFLVRLVDSVKGMPLSGVPAMQPDAPVAALHRFLLRARTDLLASHPRTSADRLQGESGRFGSLVFREWLADLQASVLPVLCEELPCVGDADADALEEFKGYLLNSFGSAQRVDYGTGHELHFLVALLHFHALFPTVAPAQLVLLVFWEYLRVMRALQATYWLEPAGSHGVWGLDDYHFLPFLFGAAQLVGHRNLRPRAIHASDIVEYLAPEYMYFECIANIVRLKESIRVSGDGSSIRWLSPLLDDISAAKTWDKVCTGLLRMWKVEVVGKLPIMQHFLFGTLLVFVSTTDADADVDAPVDDTLHYRHNLRGDCCGNALPSIYAALGAGDSTDEFIRQPGLPFD